MSESVQCRGCGRRIAIPATIDPSRARCPKCRTKIQPQSAAPDPKTPDAYQVFLAESQSLEIVASPESPAVLSLDDALPPDPKPQPRPRPVEPIHFPLPFRVAVEVLADSHREFRGTMYGVLTPHGLFLELEENRPRLYAPVGTRCRSQGRDLALTFPDRHLELRFRGTPEPEQLAEDTASFLTGRRPVPLPAEYRYPWWLAGVGAIFATGLAAGAALVASISNLSLVPSIALGVGLALAAGVANAAIGLLKSMPTGAKIAAMGLLSSAMFGLFLVGAMLFLRTEEPPGPLPMGLPPGNALPPSGSPPLLPPQAPMEPERPPTHFELAQRDGFTRLDDGPADVTALSVHPVDGSAYAAYADGSMRVWHLDQPAFEPPRLGPRAPGPVRRIQFADAGKLALLTCDTGLALVNLAGANRTPILIPGSPVAVHFEPNRERFAALRGDRVQVRYIPMNLVNNLPASKGALTLAPKDETLPLGIPATGIPPAIGKPTFLAWHPSGRLFAGGADGRIVTLPLGDKSAAFLSREHTAAVRAWELAPNGDLFFGDDNGVVGYLPNRTQRIWTFRTGGVAVRGISVNPCGGELAVLDASGWVSLWTPQGEKLLEVKQKRKISAVCYAQREDMLLRADGRSVELWWLPELATQAGVR